MLYSPRCSKLLTILFFFFFLFVSEKFRKTVILLYIKRYEIAASLFAKTKEGEVKGGVCGKDKKKKKNQA